jgi:hypothetical protein
MVLQLAPRPLFPLTRRAPKKLSSISISPKIGDSISHYCGLNLLIGQPFANWDQHLVVQTFRGKRLAGDATAIPYPFTLRVGGSGLNRGG